MLAMPLSVSILSYFFLLLLFREAPTENKKKFKFGNCPRGVGLGGSFRLGKRFVHIKPKDFKVRIL